MKVYIETYGCQMNEYDSEIVRAILDSADLQTTEDPAEADVVLINTCAVREHAVLRVINRIHEIRQMRDGAPLRLGVLGCMAKGLKKQLDASRRLPIDFVVGPDNYRNLPELIAGPIRKKQTRFEVELSDYETYADIYPRRQGGVNAWLAVMRGCNNFCSFCVVPYSRGRERSRSPRSVVDEVRRLVDEGCSQVTLLGQNVNSYKWEQNDFADLLSEVSRVEGVKRVRFTSPHPKDFPLRLLEVMAAGPKICNHIHLPLQAGSDRILKLMRRTYTREHYLELVENMRARIHGIALTTDIIVGFPGETEKEFNDTLELMRRIEFDAAYIFQYSERPGTLAERKYPDDIQEEEKGRRSVLLNALQNEISLQKNSARIGVIEQVLVERIGTKKSTEDSQGHSDGNRLVILQGGGFSLGELVDVRIHDATAHVLKGQRIS
jgi:tRNA-2-methylthio-N6-dimethylallyladenosine synthase